MGLTMRLIQHALGDEDNVLYLAVQAAPYDVLNAWRARILR